MDRRGFVTLLAPLLAGCFGGGTVQTPTNQTGTPNASATPNGTAQPNATARPDPTATPTATPTDTPEPTPSGDQREADRQLQTAREEIRAAVDAYTDVGGIEDVRADADEFVAREVYVVLVRASSAVHEASALAATDEQVRAATRLEGVVAFLSHATAGQAALIEGYGALEDLQAELGAENLGSASASVDAISQYRIDVERATADIESGSSPEDFQETDALDDDDRATKLSQFEAGITALEDFIGPVRTLVDGVETLVEARRASDDGNRAEAADLGDRASDTLSDAADEFDDVATNLPTDAQPFEEMADNLVDFAIEQSDEADNVVAQNS